MKNKIFACLALVGLTIAGTNAIAADSMSNNENVVTKAINKLTNNSSEKKVSKVSQVNNMNDDDVVYLQGYLIQNLGDEMYVFQDDSGTINVEIDDDLMQNAIAPDALVWIAATVDKDGNITSLDATEIQLLPANSNN